MSRHSKVVAQTDTQTDKHTQNTEAENVTFVRTEKLVFAYFIMEL